MRNIKKYMLEDDFAQAENNSGYSYSAVTSIRPGMAYVKENKHVYFNEVPLPPKPDFKYYYYFSGVCYQDYYYDNGEWVPDGDEGVTMIYPSNRQPVNELYETSTMQRPGRGVMMYHRVFGNGQTITLNEGDYWMMVFDGLYEGDAWIVSAKKMYTLGETASTEENNYTVTYQIFYESGDTNNTQYFVYISEETPGDYLGEYPNFWENIKILTGETFPDDLDYLDYNAYLFKVENNWPTVFPYLPTERGLYKNFYEGNDVHRYGAWPPYNMLKVEQIDEENYRVLSIDSIDFSDRNLTAKLGEYWGYAEQDSPQQAFGSVNPALSKENTEDEVSVTRPIGNADRFAQRTWDKRKRATKNETLLGASPHDNIPYSAISAFTKFVTDDVLYDYSYGQYNFKYKIFYPEEDTYHNHPFLCPVLYKLSGNNFSEEYITYPSEFFLYRSESDMYRGVSYAAGFIFRLTFEDSDLFNPPTVEDIDPEWPNLGGGGVD